MKWLILLVLIACGRHEEPGALDYRDSDGDQVQNAYESDLDKYVANVEKLGIVKGILKFNTDKGIKEISFTNKIDLNEKTLKLIVSNEKRIKKEDYFSETSILRLEEFKDMPLETKQYTFQLEFLGTNVSPDELLLVSDDSELKLGNWYQNMQINVGADDFKNIISGKSSFVVKKKYPKSVLWGEEVDQTVKNKTYRVHYFDGGKSQVMYVSKELDFYDLLKLLNIHDSREVREDDFIFKPQKDIRSEWRHRIFTNGDAALVYTSETNLNSEFLKNYTYQVQTISRENGYSKNKLELKNKKGAKVYMRIKSPKQILRSFAESSKKETFREHQTTPYSCTHFYRVIKDEKVINPGLRNLLENMVILSNGVPTPEINDYIAGQNEEYALYWNTKLDNSSEQLELFLPTLHDSTFTVTGEYKNSCGSHLIPRNGSVKTNLEGQLNFEIETYVEKID